MENRQDAMFGLENIKQVGFPALFSQKPLLPANCAVLCDNVLPHD
jgi:hypothetical protein